MALRSSSHDLNNTAKPLPIIPRRSSTLSTLPPLISADLTGNSTVKVTIQQPSPPVSNRRTPTNSALESDSSSDSENRRSCKNGGPLAASTRGDGRSASSHAAVRKKQRSDARRRRPVLALFDAAGSSSEDEAPPARSSRRISRAKMTSTLVPSTPASPVPLPDTAKPVSSIVPFPAVPQSGLASSRSASFSTGSPYDGANMLRKKSGEPVRSSLKGSRPKLRAGLSIVTTGLEIPTSKSAPTTPNKSVHFDSKLEHVRLFISAQRPLAVSVDGSPTEDTSGTESDFPSFIFGDSSKAVPVVMQLSNMPPIIKAYADVALEELKMSPDGLDIVGAARVRNLAFEKRVAVRFTFDAWQTTSEVTAKFVASICDSFDRFGFTIRVSDIMSRVVGKTLALALRYSVNGREIWDNNGGGNYVATFKKVTPPVVRAKVEELSSESDVAVLKEKLATVVRKRDGPSVTGLSPMAKQISEPTTLRQLPVSLAARYDFSSSWRNSWNGASSSQTEAYGRRQSQPNVSSAPWPMKPTQKPATPSEEPSVLGSPREPDWAGSTVASNAFLNPELRDPDAMNTPGGTPRRHQRGYFDYAIPSDGAALRRTPPGTPKMWSLDDLTPVSSPKLSFGGIERSGASGSNLGPPPLLTVSSSDSTLGTAFFPGLQRVGSTESDTSTSSMLSGDESTPSIVSPSSGSSRSSSPCPSDTSITSPHEDYSQFLNRFCFFTGDSSASPLRPPMLARTSSSSSISSSGSSRQSVAISASSSTTTITPTPSSSCLASADDMHDLSTPRIAFSSPPTATGIFT